MKKLVFLFTILISSYCYSQFECGFWAEEWYLKEISVNNNTIQLDANSEVVNVTLQCTENPTGDFFTTFCKTGIATIEHVGEDILFLNQEFAISGNACATSPNDAIEDIYFSFFTSNVSEALNLQFQNIWGNPPPLPDEIWSLTIIASNGDYLLFEDYPDQLLNTQETIFTNLKVYPNPTTSKITINPVDTSISLSFQLFNIHGQLLKSQNTLINNTISLKDLSAGIYFLQLEDENGNTTVKKIIKK